MTAVAAIHVRDVGDFIREQRRGAQISLRQLARQAGVSNPYLSQIERGLRRPSAEILQQIAKALRISAEVLYVQAGILEEREGGEDLIAAVHADDGLTERQKQVIVDIYDAFRRENALAGIVPATKPATAPRPAPDAPRTAAADTESDTDGAAGPDTPGGSAGRKPAGSRRAAGASGTARAPGTARASTGAGAASATRSVAKAARSTTGKAARAATGKAARSTATTDKAKGGAEPGGPPGATARGSGDGRRTSRSSGTRGSSADDAAPPAAQSPAARESSTGDSTT